MTNPPIPSANWPGSHLVLPPLLDSIVSGLEVNLALPPAVGMAVGASDTDGGSGREGFRLDPSRVRVTFTNPQLARSPWIHCR